MQFLKFTNTLLIAVLLSCSISGCKQEKKVVKKTLTVKKKILTTPSGAKIFYNGKEIGTTPYILTAKPNSYTVKLVKNGYKTRFARIAMKKGKNSPETFKLTPASSSVLIESTPNKAYVIRDNKRVGETPLVISDLAFGKYTVKLEKSGFSSKDISFNIDSERPIKVTTALSSNIGSISITSNPKGAKIYHDNKNIGITPFNGEIPDGKHTFILKYNNYAPVTATVTIQKGKRTSIHRNLNLLPGSFHITSSPSKARVTFNNKYMGVTPLTLSDVSSNVNHSISVSMSGYVTQTITRKTSPGRREPIKINLKRSLGDLEITTSPAGVTIYIDNIRYGVTQKAENRTTSKIMTIKNLRPGEHTIRYAHRRARPSSKSRRITISPGETTRPAPMRMWIPTAEIIYTDNSREDVIILNENSNEVFVEPTNGIRYSVPRQNLKRINYFKVQE